MYAVDFRLGKAIYSRGAMMAIEMKNYIKEKKRYINYLFCLFITVKECNVKNYGISFKFHNNVDGMYSLSGFYLLVLI